MSDEASCCAMCGEPVSRCACGYGASLTGRHAGSRPERLRAELRSIHQPEALRRWYAALDPAAQEELAEAYRSRLTALRKRDTTRP